jgi:hypothetical protein
MFFTFEISRPIQWLPGWWRCKGITTLRVWWLFFSVSLHPMRYDEMISLAGEGTAVWGGVAQRQERPTLHTADQPSAERNAAALQDICYRKSFLRQKELTDKISVRTITAWLLNLESILKASAGG